MTDEAVETAHSLEPRRRALALVLFAMLIDTIGFGIVLPVLPDLLVDITGASVSEATRQAGWLLVTFAGLQFLFSPLLGALSDRFGRRPILLLSMFVFSLNYFLMAWAPTLAWLFAGRAIAGVAGAISAPAHAYVADITPPKDRARRFGLIGAAFGLGIILGPAIGGLLGALGPRAPFFAAAALAGLNFLFGLFALPESLPAARRRAFSWARANPLGALAALRSHAGVLPVASAIFLWALALHVYPSTWAFFMTLRFGWDAPAIGASLAYVGLAMATVQVFFTGRVVRALGEEGAARAGFISAIASMLAYTIITQGWMVYAVVLLGFFNGVTGPALNAIVSARTPGNAQGELQGGVASLNGLGAIIGPLAFTETLASGTAPGLAHPFAGGAFLLAAGIMTGALLLFLGAMRSRRALPTDAVV